MHIAGPTCWPGAISLCVYCPLFYLFWDILEDNRNYDFGLPLRGYRPTATSVVVSQLSIIICDNRNGESCWVERIDSVSVRLLQYEIQPLASVASPRHPFHSQAFNCLCNFTLMIRSFVSLSFLLVCFLALFLCFCFNFHNTHLWLNSETLAELFP